MRAARAVSMVSRTHQENPLNILSTATIRSFSEFG